MNLGTQTASLQNHLYSRMTLNAPAPTIGEGATILYWTDRHAGTVVAIDAKRGIVTVREDKATVVGDCYANNFTYEADPAGRVSYFRRDKSGKWREVMQNENGRWIIRGGAGLFLGKRDKHHDFSF